MHCLLCIHRQHLRCFVPLYTYYRTSVSRLRANEVPRKYLQRTFCKSLHDKSRFVCLVCHDSFICGDQVLPRQKAKVHVLDTDCGCHHHDNRLSLRHDQILSQPHTIRLYFKESVQVYPFASPLNHRNKKAPEDRGHSFAIEIT